MLTKFTILIVFIIAEISLGIYSLAISNSLWARFLFFILSAIIVCFAIIKLSNKLLPDEDRRSKKILKKKRNVNEAS